MKQKNGRRIVVRGIERSLNKITSATHLNFYYLRLKRLLNVIGTSKFDETIESLRQDHIRLLEKEDLLKKQICRELRLKQKGRDL